MNEEKTELIAFGSSHTIEQLQVKPIKVGNDAVEISSSVEYWGIWLDSTLNMKKHISEKCRIMSLKLYNIKRISKYLSHVSLVSLVNALVLSYLDLCNALVTGLPDSSYTQMMFKASFSLYEYRHSAFYGTSGVGNNLPFFLTLDRL